MTVGCLGFSYRWDKPEGVDVILNFLMSPGGRVCKVKIIPSQPLPFLCCGFSKRLKWRKCGGILGMEKGLLEKKAGKEKII